jgi:5'-nucleotidase
MKTKKILITNDDGVNAPGLMALAVELQKFGEVTILAPDKNWSVCGHARTLDRPMKIKEVRLENGMQAFAADGSPADCVALAARGFLPQQPDLVVSGINTTANLGEDVLYSGTVAAAMESIVWGIPAVAVSLDVPAHPGESRDYSTAAYFARRVVENVSIYELGANVVLNINIPALPLEEIRGMQSTRLGRRVYHDRVERRKDPRGNPYYWIAGDAPGGIPEEGTDISAVAQGFVSITPLRADMTAHSHLGELSNWDWNERIEFNLPQKLILLPELAQ